MTERESEREREKRTNPFVLSGTKSTASNDFLDQGERGFNR